MIGQERRGEIGDGEVKAIGEPPSKEEKQALANIHTRWGVLKIRRRMVSSAIAVSVFIALLLNPVLDREEPSNCFAILIFATILWATEVSRRTGQPY